MRCRISKILSYLFTAFLLFSHLKQYLFSARIANTGDREIDHHMFLVEQYQHKFHQSGSLYNEFGCSDTLTKTIVTSLVHCFSPYISKAAAMRYLYRPHNTLPYILSPSVLWNDDGELIFAARIWQHKWQHQVNQIRPADLDNFPDNSIYIQKFDAYMQPLSAGKLLGISSAWKGKDDGPYDPRLLKLGRKVYMTFNAEMRLNKSTSVDSVHLWDFEKNLPVTFRIKGGSQMLKLKERMDIPRDKNWSSFVKNNQLYFLYLYDPLMILHCTVTGNCEFLEAGSNFISSSETPLCLRGGTPFEFYQDNYHISFAHSMLHMSRKFRSRIYHVHLVMLHFGEPFRIVYISHPVQIHPAIYTDAPQAAQTVISDFFFPVSLIIEDKDSFIIGAHVNDSKSILLRIRGVQALLSEIINLDRLRKPKRGPPNGYLQSHVMNITRLAFSNKEQMQGL